MISAMVPLSMKKKAERRLRQLLAEGGFAQPEEVQYGTNSVTLVWPSVNKSVVVDVTDRGEVGKSRAGPPPRRPSGNPESGNGSIVSPRRLATLRQKKKAEQNARAMLDDHGIPQPDEVEYGEACIRLLWHEEKLALVIGISEPPAGRLPSDFEPEADVYEVAKRQN
jgi:hypothetical protein